MTMDFMIDYLRERGFKATKEYKPIDEAYTFCISKDNFNLVRKFAYPRTPNPVERDRIQRYFLDEIIEDFKREFEKENNMKEDTIKWDVKCVNIERDTPYDFPTITAELKGLINPRGDYNLDPTKLAVELHNRLGRPLTAEQQYIINDCTMTKQLMNSVYGAGAFRSSKPTLKIKKVIFNNPATIIYWMDDTKTVVKCQNNEPFDPEKGLTMAITKRVLGDKGNYFEVIKKYTKDVPNYRVDDLETKNKVLNESMHNSYKTLLTVLNNKKATKAELTAAMEEAIGYLGCGLNE